MNTVKAVVQPIVLVVFVVVVQVVVVSQVTIFGARGDIVLLLAIAAGISAGPERGAEIGFAAGLTYDLLLSTPLGLSALVYCIVGFVMGAIHSSVLRAAGWIPVLNAVLASAAGVVLYALVGRVLGLATFSGPALPVIVAVVSLLNGIVALPLIGACRRALSVGQRQRVFVR